ncbi:hypothetical protein SAMN04488074_111110 [Lentzea albidocapillata subsp. violacea]|uniref:Uncharacterized protein n=1 Tax=Lentzea albidocapillata subsp. violacea TaxID=128104 RepID=A0A1G9KDG1_9PSEU|nr:hypothetical protein [Lentzea albidocapillata]SDL47666.1 hypothetical protein SAMN04488074_111110 [Lentzea albidocapillata subsp. violacea]
MLRLALVFVLLMSGTAHALPLDVRCRVPGVHDADVIRAVHAVGLSLRVSDKVMLAGFEAGWVESHMNNLSCGDRDSLGVFQQRPSMGWGTPEQIMDVSYAARRFFEYAVRVDRPELSAGLLADAVQRSCCPERYDQAQSRAGSMLRQAWQGGPEVVGGVVHVVQDGDVWAGGSRLSTSGDFVGRPSVAGHSVYARTARGEVRALARGAARTVASGVAADPEAVVRPDGTVDLYAVLADGSVAKLSDLPEMIGMGGGSPQGALQSGSIPSWQPVSAAGFAAGKPSAVAYPDGSVVVYVRSGDKLMAGPAGAWREIARSLEASPEAVLRPDGTVGVHTLIAGRPHRLTTTWEPLGEARFIDTVSAQPDGTVYARTAEGSVLKAG